MRIGIVIGLHGSAAAAPRWRQLRDEVQAAERAGFDLAVIEDGLLYRDDDGSIGYWESVSVAGALCAATTSIEVAHSVINAPYRSAGLVAKIADTLDEIAGGRYTLGIGLGNTPDYDQFGIRADQRFARFSESIEIIHALLKTGCANYDGRFQFARGAEMVPRGPRPTGPPIVISARGPRMMQLAARYADGWNWWSSGPVEEEGLRALLGEVDGACAAAGREPRSLTRSLDLYSLDPLASRTPPDGAIAGTAAELAADLSRLREIGFDEVRCNVVAGEEPGDRWRAIEALTEVVELVHAAV